MHPLRRASHLLLAVALCAGALAALGPAAAGASPNPPGRVGPAPALAALSPAVAALDADSGPVHLMLELSDRPALLAYAAVDARPDASAAQAAQAGASQAARIDRAQGQALAAIAAAAPAATVLYQVRNAYNGIAVLADAASLPQLRGIPGVRAIHRLALHERSNAASVPLIGAPQVWESLGLTGQGVSIGVIDTGIDYVHTMFGGTGAAGDLADARDPANNVGLSGPGAVPAGFKVLNGAAAQLYPSPKVVGGFDFAGDTYNADPASAGYNPTPQPDANPIDCPSTLGGGHGSHVAGTAAGYGVNADGSSFAGPWDSTVPFATMRIGPGVAPQAQLYALRVFGCGGSTALTTLAIDWAVDPNGDGDFADHLDVINMSLGSSYGTPDDASAVASDNAAAAGVIVVASAGNSGDVHYISGSPGSSARTLTVASSVDSTDTVDAFQVGSPAAFAGLKPATFSANFAWSGSAPLSADLVYDGGANRFGCSAMAAGSLTGKVLLVDWATAGSSSFPCGSTARANNAANAGAVGLIIASGQPFFDTSISGNAAIRAVFTTSTTGDELKAALAAGTVAITFSNAYKNAGRFVVAGLEDTVSSFTSRGPRGRDSALKPDIAAPGQGIFSADSGTGNLGRSLNGTSMAAPHMAGVMALLRQSKPAWTVEELKALAMNTAENDLFSGQGRTGAKFGPARVGAGRVDVPAALSSAVIAYDAAAGGAVSVFFGAVEVLGTLARDRAVTVVNKGASAVTYALAYDARTAIPGVTYLFPDGPTVSVPAGASATFRVRLSADAAAMTNSRDATVSATYATSACGGSTCPRNWLSEASGLITLTPASGQALRLPVYAVARPASALTTTAPTIPVTADSFTTALELAGTSVSSGPMGADHHTSLVTALELQGLSPQLAAPPAGFAASSLNADLQYIGAGASPSTLFFGLTTWRDRGTLAGDVQFNIFIDRDRNGTDDLQLFTARLAADADVFVTALATLPSTSGTIQAFANIYAADIPTALLNSNVIVMPVGISALGLPGGATRLDYRVESFSSRNGTVDRFPATGYLSYDVANPGLDFSGGVADPPMYVAAPGAQLPLVYNQANYLANNSSGALLLHHYNAQGERAQVVPLVPSVAFVAPPAAKTYGDAPFAVSATATLGQAVSYSSTTPAVCTVSGGEVTIVGAGACVVRAATAPTANFGAGSAETTISVAKAPLGVAVDNATRRLGAPNPPFSVAFTGFVNGDDAGDLGGALAFSTTATPASALGSYPITASGLTSANYALTYTPGTLTVTELLLNLPLLRR